MKLVLAADVTSRTGLSESTLQQWLTDGRLCEDGTSSRRVYDLAEVEQLMHLLGASTGQAP